MHDKWVLFTVNGSYILDIPTGKLSRYSELNIKNGAVTRDNKKNVWVHNYTGNLWYVDITTGKIKPFQFLSSKHIGYIDVERYSIVHAHGTFSGYRLTATGFTLMNIDG